MPTKLMVSFAIGGGDSLKTMPPATSSILRHQWLTADYAAKRRILEIVCLNCRLIDAKLCPEIRKPFDVLVEGLLVPESGG